MAHDIDLIIERLAKVRPEVKVTQLEVMHPADDDGLWFIVETGGISRVQLESSTYNFPFMVEADHLGHALTVNTVEEAVALIQKLLDRDL